MAKPVGWRRESARHGLAAKGIKTGTTQRRWANREIERNRVLEVKTAAITKLQRRLDILSQRETKLSEEWDHEELVDAIAAAVDASHDEVEMMLLEQDLENVRREIHTVEAAIETVVMWREESSLKQMPHAYPVEELDRPGEGTVEAITLTKEDILQGEIERLGHIAASRAYVSDTP